MLQALEQSSKASGYQGATTGSGAAMRAMCGSHSPDRGCREAEGNHINVQAAENSDRATVAALYERRFFRRS